MHTFINQNTDTLRNSIKLCNINAILLTQPHEYLNLLLYTFLLLSQFTQDNKTNIPYKKHIIFDGSLTSTVGS